MLYLLYERYIFPQNNDNKNAKSKSPFLKKNKPSKKMTDTNRRKQKFAIIDYYKKKNASSKAGKSSKDSK